MKHEDLKKKEVTMIFIGSRRWTNLRRHGACCSTRNKPSL